MDGQGRNQKTDRFHFERRSTSHRIHHQRRIQYRSRHHKNRETNTAIQRLPHAQTKHLPQPWRLRLGKTRRERSPGKALEKTGIPIKKVRVQRQHQEVFLCRSSSPVSRIKNERKNNPRKAPNLKSTMDLETQTSYEKQSAIPAALVKDKEVKQEPIRKIQTRQKRVPQKDKNRNNNNHNTKKTTIADSVDIKT